MDARRLQTLTRQRERLEMEVRNLEAEILDLVRTLLFYGPLSNTSSRTCGLQVDRLSAARSYLSLVGPSQQYN